MAKGEPRYQNPPFKTTPRISSLGTLDDVHSLDMTSKREEMLKALQDCPGELSGLLSARPDLLSPETPVEAEPEPEMTYFDPEEWARKKQESRNKDAEVLASGRKTEEQLRIENCMLPLDAVLDREKMPRF